MTSAVSALAVVAAIVVSSPVRRARIRVPATPRLRLSRRLLFALVVTGLAGVVVLGPVAVAATLVVVVVLVTRRRTRALSQAQASDLALTLDVLAGCLAAGASMPAALGAAQGAAPDAVRAALASAALAVSRGDDPVVLWAQLARDAPELDNVARLCARAASTGAAVVAELHRLAATKRTELDSARRRRLQRASVWLVLPLGLCFLPAFVLVGVIPLVIGAMPAALGR